MDKQLLSRQLGTAMIPDLVTTDKLCETCRQVSPFTVSAVVPMPDGCDEFGYRHLTLEALQQSANSCPLCHVIAQELSRGDEPINTKAGQRVILYSDVYPTTEYGPRHVGLVLIQLSDSNRHGYLQAFAEPGDKLITLCGRHLISCLLFVV